MLRRYWIEFYPSTEQPPLGLRLGCGVTAYDESDALGLIQTRVFGGAPLPDIAQITPDVNISTLDEKHVRPNMGVCSRRGVWFPLGYGTE